MAQRNAAASRPPFVDGAMDGEVSLVRGGPFCRAQQAARLIESDRWNLGRRIVFAVAATWVPLVLITLLFNPEAIRSLLGDYFVNGRILFVRRAGHEDELLGAPEVSTLTDLATSYETSYRCNRFLLTERRSLHHCLRLCFPYCPPFSLKSPHPRC